MPEAPATGTGDETSLPLPDWPGALEPPQSSGPLAARHDIVIGACQVQGSLRLRKIRDDSQIDGPRPS